VLCGVSDRRGQTDYNGDLLLEVPLSRGAREETGRGSACSESGTSSASLAYLLSSGMALGLCTLRCIALHFCFSIACCFVRVGFSFNPCVINIVTHVVGGIFSGLCAPEWCEKSLTIKSLVVQWGGSILTYGATLVLLRCFCLYNAFLGPFSLVLSRASFSYLFCLGLTQTTVFMLRRWSCSRDMDPTKEIEGRSLQYLSQIREMLAIDSFILAVLKERKNSFPGETTQDTSLFPKEEAEGKQLIADTERHYRHIREDMTKCYRARKRIEVSMGSYSMSQGDLLREGELKDWGAILNETIGKNLQLCPNSENDTIGSIIEKYIKLIWEDSKSILRQLSSLQKENCKPREESIWLSLKLASRCEQFCGTYEFMKTFALSEDEGKAECSMQSMQEWNKSLEEVYQRVELSYSTKVSKVYPVKRQKEVLSARVESFPDTQQEHIALLERWWDHFYLLKMLSSALPFSKGRDYMVFQATRMCLRIQHIVREEEGGAEMRYRCTKWIRSA